MIESKFKFTPEVKDKKSISVQDFLRDTIERLPEMHELPASIDIGAPFSFMDEAIAENGVQQQSVKDVLGDLRALEDAHGHEFASTIVERGGRFVLGPYIEGDEQSVSISAPLRRTEKQTESGLYICEMDAIVAGMHSHRVDATFSIADLLHAMGYGNERVRQSYIVRKNGGIDMVVRTQESKAFGKGVMEELIDLWNEFEAQFNSTAVAQNNAEWLRERNDYILQVIVEKLGMGFYTNHGNEGRSSLHRVVSE